MNVFFELSVIIIIASLVALIVRLLRQPLVVGYILTGILVGPYALNILHSTESIELFSKIGIATLLFIVGLSLNPLVVKEVGKTSLFTGLGQVLFTMLVAFSIVWGLGYTLIPALYIALALTFSSTIIILKILSDKGDLNKFYSKVSIGILLIQDIIATLTLVVISTLSQTQGADFLNVISLLLLKGIAAIVVLFIISRFVLPRLANLFAASQELLFIFSLGWGFGLAAVFSWLGFSIEIGALIAGVALSVSPFAYEIGARIKPLRDFFIIIFFILLGSQIVIEHISALIIPAVILSLFVLIGKPLIVLILMNMLRYKRKIGFSAGLTMAQISEFSLILAALGVSFGHIDREVASLITLIGIISIAGSTYLMMYSDALYARFGSHLKLFDSKKSARKIKSNSCLEFNSIIFGYDRVGSDFVKTFQKLQKTYLVVDFNPDSIRKLQDKKIPFRYGDAEDVEFLEELELQCTEFIVSTIPDFKTNLLLIRTYRRMNPTGIALVISDDIEHAKQLYLAGASYVIMPHYLGAHHASLMIARHGFDHEEFERERNIHLSRISKRES